MDLFPDAVETLDGNGAAKVAVERHVDAHGGRYEGLLRGERQASGEVHDVHRYSIARDEWAADAGVAVRFP